MRVCGKQTPEREQRNRGDYTPVVSVNAEMTDGILVCFLYFYFLSSLRDLREMGISDSLFECLRIYYLGRDPVLRVVASMYYDDKLVMLHVSMSFEFPLYLSRRRLPFLITSFPTIFTSKINLLTLKPQPLQLKPFTLNARKRITSRHPTKRITPISRIHPPRSPTRDTNAPGAPISPPNLLLIPIAFPVSAVKMPVSEVDGGQDLAAVAAGEEVVFAGNLT